MFGPLATERERSIAAALDECHLQWLPSRLPAAEAFFRSRISGLWSVFLIVGLSDDDASDVIDFPVPSIEIRRMFTDFLEDAPMFVLVDGAERLWPAWDAWQQLVQGGYASISVTRLPPGISADNVAATVGDIVASLPLMTSARTL